MTSSGHVPFQSHVELLQLFLSYRDAIVEKIAELLNAQRKPIQYMQEGPILSRHFEDCFFTLNSVTRDQSHLRGSLEKAHWASGFKPREQPGQHNDLVDPAEMMVRGFHLWRQTHWPGHSGRVRYAHTLFNLQLIRQLTLLTMRLWDDEDLPKNRLSQLQALLDQLWKTTPADHPVLVRDVRWLIPVAQSPTTVELAAYFEVAQRISETLPEDDRIEIHKASVRMAGGHLRSQLRHVSLKKGVSLNESGIVLSTRKSNALDLALLIQGLLPLLVAYESTLEQTGDRAEKARIDLASSICQGISPDPDLFLNRLDLLGPYSMIEYLFIKNRDGQAVYTAMGQRHVELLREYNARIRRLSKPLYDDCRQFRPVEGTYSPYGILYGFSSNLFEHMALKTIQIDAVVRFSLEDVFSDGDADKLAWVSGWRKLPHIKPEMAKLFEYPQKFAEEIFDRIEQALRRRNSSREMRAGRLYLPSADDPQAESKTSQIPELPVQYVRSSDAEIVSAHKAESYEQTQLLQERQEGEFIVSYNTPGGWVAISKDVLTDILGEGRDVKLAGLPPDAAEVLKLMCPNLLFDVMD
jgi:hypothetical protein